MNVEKKKKVIFGSVFMLVIVILSICIIVDGCQPEVTPTPVIPTDKPTKTVEPSPTFTVEPTDKPTKTVEPTATNTRMPTIPVFTKTATSTRFIIWFADGECNHQWGVYGQRQCYCDHEGKPFIFQGHCPAYFEPNK